MEAEELKIDCGNCKDLEFARNLVAQMKGGYGRHNSVRDIPAQRPSGPESMMCFDERAILNIENVFNQLADTRMARPQYPGPIFANNLDHQAPLRVVGLVDRETIRLRLGDCHIGDCCPRERYPWAEKRRYLAFRPLPERIPMEHWFINTFFWNESIEGREDWMFELVTEVGTENKFWKRVS